MTKEREFTSTHQYRYYGSMTTAFVVLLILSNLAAIKLCDFFGYALDAGTAIFPVLYILSDVLTEVYGFSASRRAIYTAFSYNIFFSITMYMVILFPASDYWDKQSAFEQIFLTSPRIVVASVTSYFAGELINTSIIAFLKIKFAGRYFVFRAISSTLIGALTESIAFSYIAFYSTLHVDALLEMIILLTTIKVLYEMLAMPITVRLVNFLKRKEEIDVFETPSLRALLPDFIMKKIKYCQQT